MSGPGSSESESSCSVAGGVGSCCFGSSGGLGKTVIDVTRRGGIAQ
jgi:hypothetical protein